MQDPLQQTSHSLVRNCHLLRTLYLTMKMCVLPHRNSLSFVWRENDVKDLGYLLQEAGPPYYYYKNKWGSFRLFTQIDS